MAAETIRELIEVNVADSLTVIRRGAGFSVDLNTICPWKTSEFNPLELAAAAVYFTDDYMAPERRSLPFEYRYAGATVELWDARPLRDEDIRPKLNGMMGDVYKALMADPTRGGRALDTEYGNVGTMIFKTQIAVQVAFLIKYRFLYKDPTGPTQ